MANLNTILVVLLGILISISTVFCVQQQLHLYSEVGGQGDISVTLTGTRYPNLDSISSFLPSIKSFCTVGWWTFYSDPNYEGGSGGEGYTEARKCRNATWTWGSLRMLGAPDTTKPLITLFEREYFRGEEFTLDNLSSPQIPFKAYSVATSGSSNWTLFSEPEFGGRAVCFVSKTPIQTQASLFLVINNVGSVAYGCVEGRIDQYV